MPPVPHYRLALAILAVLAIATGACTNLPPPTTPTETSDWQLPTPSTNPNWQPGQTCATTDKLIVELGQGPGTYEPLAPGQLPAIYMGGGAQGGLSQHFWGAVRVVNPDPAHHNFLLHFGACTPAYNPSSVDQHFDAKGWGDTVCPELTVVPALLPNAASASDGSVSGAGFQVRLPSPYLVRVQLQVQDECGRVGSDERP